MRSTTATANPDDGKAKLVRNHFKGWNVGASGVNEVVWIKETAAGTEWRATLYVAKYLLIPATKVHGGEHGNQNDPLHYVAYVVEPVPSKTEFRFENQFTKPGIAIWNFTTSRPSYLLVPAVKKHAEHEAQEAQAPKADHLLCYAVQMAQPFTRPVSAIDQFTKNPAPTVNTLMPSHICVPVFKRKDNSEIWEGVDHPDDYLAIYSYHLSPNEPYSGVVYTTDQLRSAQKLNVMFSELLAVPSTKIAVDPPGTGVGSTSSLCSYLRSAWQRIRMFVACCSVAVHRRGQERHRRAELDGVAMA